MIFADLPRTLAQYDDLPDENEIRQLPQFFRADADMAWRLGGPRVRRVLQDANFLARWKYISIDSRVHMLMPGMYPCIPGWHCDDFYRPEREPELRKLTSNAPSEHAAIVFGKVARTVYLTSVLDWTPQWSYGEHLYGVAHDFIEALKDKTARAVLNGELVWFSPLTWHQGAPAADQGWRFFMRITGSNHWEPKNELRTQTQVYLTKPFAGW